MICAVRLSSIRLFILDHRFTAEKEVDRCTSCSYISRRDSGRRRRVQRQWGWRMNSNQKLSFAIAAILGGHASSPAYAATEGTASTDEGIPEVVVTATRRAENLQDVPIAITALT